MRERATIPRGGRPGVPVDVRDLEPVIERMLGGLPSAAGIA
jgi:hypothetical protein